MSFQGTSDGQRGHAAPREPPSQGRKRDLTGASRLRPDLLPTLTAASSSSIDTEGSPARIVQLADNFQDLQVSSFTPFFSTGVGSLARGVSAMALSDPTTRERLAVTPTPMHTPTRNPLSALSSMTSSYGDISPEWLWTGGTGQRSRGQPATMHGDNGMRGDPDQRGMEMGSTQRPAPLGEVAHLQSHPASSEAITHLPIYEDPCSSRPLPPPSSPSALGLSTLHRQSSLIPGPGLGPPDDTTRIAGAPPYKGPPHPVGKRDRAADVLYQRGGDKENRPALAPLDPSMLSPLADSFSSTAAFGLSAAAAATSNGNQLTMPRTPKRARGTPPAASTLPHAAARPKPGSSSKALDQGAAQARSASARKIMNLGRSTSMTLRSGTEVLTPDTTPSKRRNELELTIAPGLGLPAAYTRSEVDSASMSPEQDVRLGMPATMLAKDEGVCVAEEQMEVMAVDGDVSMEVGKASTLEVGITDMPDEILMEILLYLPLASILTMSTISRKLNFLARDNIVWQNLYFQTPGFKIRRPRQSYQSGQKPPLPGEVVVDGDAFFSPTAPYWIPLSPFDAVHTPAGKSYRRPLWQRYEELDGRMSGGRPVSPGTASTWSDCGTPVHDGSGRSFWSSPLAAMSTNATAYERQSARAAESHSQPSTWRARSPMSPSGIFTSLIGSSARSEPGPSQQALLRTPRTSNVGVQPLPPQPLDWLAVYQERILLEHRWSTGSYTSCVSLPQAHKEAIYCVQTLHDRLVTGSRDKHVRFWSVEMGVDNPVRGAPQLIHDLVDAHTRSVLCLQIEEGTGSDGQGMMVCGSSDFHISVWELRGALDPARSRAGLRGRPCKPKKIKLLKGHTGGVLDVAMNKHKLVSCSKDASIRIWSRGDWTLLLNIKDHAGPVNALALKYDGTLVSAAGDGSILVFDIQSGRIIRDFQLTAGLACVDYKGDVIVSGSSDLVVRATNALTGDTIAEMTGHQELVRTLEYNEEHGRAVSGSYDASLFLWDIKRGVPIKQLENKHQGMVFNARLDATKIVSTSHDCSMMVHDFSGGLKYAALFA